MANQDLISKDVLKEYITGWLNMDKYYHPYSQGKTIPTSEILDLIDRVPVVDIDKEVWNRSNELLEKRLTYLGSSKGEWIDEGVNGWKCDKCGYGVLRYNNTNFCPNCGVRMGMRGENDGFNG